MQVWRVVNVVRWTAEVLRNARYSRDGVLAIDASVDRDSPRQNQLVGGSEIGTLSETCEAFTTLYGMEGRGHTTVDKRAIR